jgi:hypothetical protein
VDSHPREIHKGDERVPLAMARMPCYPSVLYSCLEGRPRSPLVELIDSCGAAIADANDSHRS